MSRETINLICSELPGSDRSEASGGDVWTVGGETFATIAAGRGGVSVRRGDAGGQAWTDAAWIELPVETTQDDLRRSIVDSYEIVRKSLPEEVQVTLDRTSG